MKEIYNCIIFDYDEIPFNNKGINQILDNTVNTWQPNRGLAEKGRDTSQGKLAEQAVELFFSDYCPSVTYISYDELRTDNYKLSAPFDGILADRDIRTAVLNDYILKINNEVKSDGTLSARLRAAMAEAGIYTVEIKSTKIKGYKRNKAAFISYENDGQVCRLIDEICNADDFLTYTNYIRKGNFEWEDYCLYAKGKNRAFSALSGKDLHNAVKAYEIANMDDFYIRVYIDDLLNKAIRRFIK